MSESVTVKEGAPEKINPQEVVRYLLEHPDFFNQYPDLITTLDIPHGEHGSISLVEYQVSRLRAAYHKLETTINAMIANAKTNEMHIQRMHTLILRLLSAANPPEFISELNTGLSDQFNMDAVEVRIFVSTSVLTQFTDDNHFFAIDSEKYATLKSLIAAETPMIMTQQLVPEQHAVFFPDNTLSAELQSMIILPLQADEWSGVILMGSNQASRFEEGMAVDLLRQLGGFLSIILSLHLVGKAQRT